MSCPPHNRGLDDIPIRDLQDVPSNVQIYNWIPVLDLYQDTDLIIHHGGHASCLSSLIYGTPTLVMPTHSEREYNARKLSELGSLNLLIHAHVLILNF